MPKSDPAARAAEAATLRERFGLMLDAVEREEPGPYITQLRSAVAGARSLPSTV